MKSSQQLRTVILDIETDDDADFNPSVIWCVVAKDVDTNEVFVFRRPDLQPDGFSDFISGVSVVIGHNIITSIGLTLLGLLGILDHPVYTILSSCLACLISTLTAAILYELGVSALDAERSNSTTIPN